MSHAGLLARLLPPVSYAPAAPQLAAQLAAEGRGLDAAQHSASRVAAAVTPYFAEQLLPDWERVCGMTPSAGAGYQQRLQAVLAKLAETGGLSIAYFTRLAAGLGYRITITEPQPFQAGMGRAGDCLELPEVVFVWRVDVAGDTRLFPFVAGLGSAGDALTTFGEPVIESLFHDLKPAHTFVYFTYQG